MYTNQPHLGVFPIVFQCYDRLGQWDKLEEACHHHLDIDPSADEMSLDVVWDSEINQVIT